MFSPASLRRVELVNRCSLSIVAHCQFNRATCAIVLVICVILDSALQHGKIVSKCDIGHLLVDLANAATDKPS